MRRLMRPGILVPLLAAYFVMAGFVAGLWFPLFFGGITLLVLAVARALVSRRRQAWALGAAGLLMSTSGYLWTSHPEWLRGKGDEPIVAIPASSSSAKRSPSPAARRKAVKTPTPSPTPMAASTRTVQPVAPTTAWTEPSWTPLTSQPSATRATSTVTQPAAPVRTRRPVNRQPVDDQTSHMPSETTGGGTAPSGAAPANPVTTGSAAPAPQTPRSGATGGARQAPTTAGVAETAAAVTTP